MREFDVGVERAVSHHDALRESGSTGGVVYQCEFISAVLIVIQVLRTEVVRVFVAETFIQMLTNLGHLLSLGIVEAEGIDLHDYIKTRHFSL